MENQQSQVTLNSKPMLKEELKKEEEKLKTTERNVDIVEVAKDTFKTRLRD